MPRRVTRLFVILARAARVAVVLRRGPSKEVLLVRWDLATDAFEAGQWLNGRVYERRCDLSPSGELVVCFVASYRRRPDARSSLRVSQRVSQ